jgi:hypothetical protein
MKIVKMVTVIIILLLAIGGFMLYRALPNENTFYNVKEFHSSKSDNALYLKSITWGMTSDSRLIIISESPEKKYLVDSTSNYIYEGLSPLLYKFENDTLFLYTMNKSAVPQNLKSKIKIQQIEIENPEMMRLIKDDYYKKQGLNIME